MAYTLSQLRALLDPTCFPAAASSAAKNTLINKVREAFYFTPAQEGGGNSLWRGIITQAIIPVVTQFALANGFQPQTITLTRQYFTALKARNCFGPVGVINDFQQFDGAYCNGCTIGDLGDGFCGISDINASGATMKITTTATEIGGLNVTFIGTDSAGNPISESVAVPAVSGNSVSTGTVFYAITEVVKSTTAGDLICNQTTAAVDTLFARYAASENTPNYRRYRLNYRERNASLTLFVKRRYYQLSADNDESEFDSLLAYECGLRAYRWSLSNDLTNYRAGLVEAIGYLNGIENAHQAETAYGPTQIGYDYGMASVPNLL